MVAVAVLLAVFGSGGDVADAVAVFVIWPFLFGFTMIVTVTVAPLAMVPRLHPTSVLLGFSEQLPCVVEELP